MPANGCPLNASRCSGPPEPRHAWGSCCVAATRRMQQYVDPLYGALFSWCCRGAGCGCDGRWEGLRLGAHMQTAGPSDVGSALEEHGQQSVGPRPLITCFFSPQAIRYSLCSSNQLLHPSGCRLMRPGAQLALLCAGVGLAAAVSPQGDHRLIGMA